MTSKERSTNNQPYNEDSFNFKKKKATHLLADQKSDCDQENSTHLGKPLVLLLKQQSKFLRLFIHYVIKVIKIPLAIE